MKKVMKSDPEVKMIAADGGTHPVLQGLRNLYLGDNRTSLHRRGFEQTALAKSDQFDFLIDIVPRDDGHGHGAGQGGSAGQGLDQAARKKRKENNGQQGQPPTNGSDSRPEGVALDTSTVASGSGALEEMKQLLEDPTSPVERHSRPAQGPLG
ncbi:hypothetical protein PUNSTDRAFT_138675 [Punctularia strigosozonata HHB-11173 SS5]|uniref:Transcription factor CBF/NF-Y/archaeal histone domain-containing protein n=1 Tax=Punctularia strigosozonata (strain HHB-11173) TaxID=741275 RepID=R7S1M5_PUNST|nr:uncharacterized protein PUNSTDRAFT_138675 [Punctularia strigosozonata HHB-11173 SS5]EIN04280.1 hypothetical protein PUNSTDRAFT_138675 [Punctularia strigosozonata HHB-11173 SS5]